MKKSIYLVLSLTAVLLLNSCSSVKVLSSWKADNVDTVRDNNILVIARTQNKQARIAFENEIVAQLTSSGMKATASFTKFPKLNPDEEVNEERAKMIREILDNEVWYFKASFIATCGESELSDEDSNAFQVI